MKCMKNEIRRQTVGSITFKLIILLELHLIVISLNFIMGLVDACLPEVIRPVAKKLHMKKYAFIKKFTTFTQSLRNFVKIRSS